MNCGLCGLPKDTGAIGSVLPQCICHWKHTPYTNTSQELNDGGEPVKNATYWKRQHDRLLMNLNVSAIKIAELEKDLALKTRDRDVFKNFTLAYEERIAELEKENSELKYEKSSGVYDLAKTLTDEEIIKTMVQFDVYSADDQCLIEAGRAILRKAQEK